LTIEPVTVAGLKEVDPAAKVREYLGEQIRGDEDVTLTETFAQDANADVGGKLLTISQADAKAFGDSTGGVIKELDQKREFGRCAGTQKGDVSQ
jgi:hypothetical protein